MPSLSEETGGRVSMLMPGSTIGIIGGGQLGRMMALSARYMGFRVGVLDPTPNCPTGQVADFQITAEYDDKTAIHDLAVQSDVLTYEFENVDAGAIDEVRGITATPQGTDLLRVTQHRVREKQFINDHGTATAPWRAVNNFDELDAALGDIHYPAVLKTVSGGYDGPRSARAAFRRRLGEDPLPLRPWWWLPAEHPGRLRRLRIRGFDSGLRQRQGLRHLPDCA